MTTFMITTQVYGLVEIIMVVVYNVYVRYVLIYAYLRR